MTTNRFILFLWFTVFLIVNSEKCFSHDSPISLDMINQNKICGERWDNFKDEISWFVDYNNPCKNMAPIEDILEDQYLREKWSRKQNEFSQSLAKADQSFYEFRRSVEDAVAAKFGEGRYADHASSQAGIELTKWYIEFMENQLFPPDWKDLYEHDKKTQNQSLPKAHHPKQIINRCQIDNALDECRNVCL